MNYGFFALFAKLVQFISLLFLESNLESTLFGELSSGISVQMGVTMLLTFGVNEGFVGTYLKYNKNDLLRGLSYLLGVFSSSVVLILILFALSFNGKFDIYPLINGVILFDLFLNASFFKIENEHRKSQLYQYVAMSLFYASLTVAILLGFDQQVFAFSSAVLVVYFLILKQRGFFYNFREAIVKYNRLKSILKKIIRESKNYFLISVFGWLTTFGVTLYLGLYVSSAEAGQYFFISAIAGSVLVVTNSLFSVWNPNYFHGKIDAETNNYFYRWLMLSLMIFSLILTIGYGLYRGYDPNAMLKMMLVSLQYVFYVPFWKIRYAKQKSNDGLSLAKLVIVSSVLGLLVCSVGWLLIGEWVAYSYGLILSVVHVLVSYKVTNVSVRDLYIYVALLIAIVSFLYFGDLDLLKLFALLILLLVPFGIVTNRAIKQNIINNCSRIIDE